MAFIILEGTAPQRSEVQRLKQNLIKSFEDAGSIKRQIDEMTDQQVETQYGVPAVAISAFRTNIANLETALEATAVTNIISSVGFSL